MSKAWMLRPEPHGHNRISEFLSNNIIAIGWPFIDDLTGKSREEIKNLLAAPPYNYASLKLGNAYGTVDILVNQMEKDDLVLVPNNEDIYFCQIKSSYQYVSALDNDQDGYPHQRKVTWLAPTKRENLPMDIRSSLKAQQTATNLSKYYDVIKAIAYGKEIPLHSTANLAVNYVSVDYPLRPNEKITITVPQDITKIEAERLGDFIKTIYYK